jgi:hypothetical protein
MWPTFIGATLLDAVLMHTLPPVATGIEFVPALLIATFANLAVIGALAPWLAGRIWKRRPEAAPGAPPKAQREVLTDRLGTGLLLAGVLGVLAAGLAARPLVVGETDAKEEAARAIDAHVKRSGDEELIRNLQTANTARLREDYFRICIALDDRERYACFFVDTGRQPAEITRDPSQLRNPFD